MEDLKIVKMVLNKDYGALKETFNQMIADKIASRIQMKKEKFVKEMRGK